VHPLAVTVSGQTHGDTESRARAAAERWSLPYVARRHKSSLGALLETAASAFLVFTAEGVVLRDATGAMSFSPGMAKLRVKRIDAGETDDLLVRLGELRPGDSVLDCTLGLAADALVAARAVGTAGRVVGIEKSLAIYGLVSEGLRDYDPGPRSCRIEPVHADAAHFLETSEAGAFDVVLFDPMFERSQSASPSFEFIRRYADYAQVTSEMLEQARRVARRWVLIKGARYSPVFKRLGLKPEPIARTSPVGWARVAAQRGQADLTPK
jgi:hypothetical protein